jgi:hypothetical protein
MTDNQPILAAVEAFLAETGMSKTRFGKGRCGRSPLCARSA